MESLRRKIKIFWTEHGTPILFYTLVILGILSAIKILDIIAANNQKQNNTINNTVAKVSIKEEKQNEILLKKFIQFCENNEIDNAYELLSENCKQEKYPTKESFLNYYNKTFKQYNTIWKHSQGEEYKIQFYEDELVTGTTDKQIIQEDTYKIEHEILEDKLYINLKDGIK